LGGHPCNPFDGGARVSNPFAPIASSKCPGLRSKQRKNAERLVGASAGRASGCVPKRMRPRRRRRALSGRVLGSGPERLLVGEVGPRHPGEMSLCGCVPPSNSPKPDQPLNARTPRTPRTRQEGGNQPLYYGGPPPFDPDVSMDPWMLYVRLRHARMRRLFT
jgi:hypothetical protein